MNLKTRIAVERRIARKIVRAALAAGYQIAIDNGGDDIGAASTSEAAIMAGMFATDDEWLLLYRAGKPAVGRADAFVYFVYGNDGFDVVADYTASLDASFMADVNVYTEMLEARLG